jgi:hypothetical protein
VITPSLRRPSGPTYFRQGVRIAVFLLLGAAFALALAKVSASDVSAQKRTNEKPYAVIFGTVWGPDDKPVYGVKVKIRREDQKKARWEAYSDHHGEFAVRVPAGKAEYVAWTDLKGYKSLDGARLQPGESVTIDVTYDERVDTGLHLK